MDEAALHPLALAVVEVIRSQVAVWLAVGEHVADGNEDAVAHGHHRALISRQGDRGLRARLYTGARGALRGANPLRAFYQRLVDRGKPQKLALLVAARKLLAWAWAVFNSDQRFDAAKTVKLVA